MPVFPQFVDCAGALVGDRQKLKCLGNFYPGKIRCLPGLMAAELGFCESQWSLKLGFKHIRPRFNYLSIFVHLGL